MHDRVMLRANRVLRVYANILLDAGLYDTIFLQLPCGMTNSTAAVRNVRSCIKDVIG